MPPPEVVAPPEQRHSGMMRNRLSVVAFPLLILIIVSGFYWKLTLTHQYDWVTGPDMADQVLPWFEEQARQIQHRHIPLWDPHGWLGEPMLGLGQPGTAYPLNWLLFLIPESHGHIRIGALQWYFVAVHFMAALFCYLLCLDLGCSRTASLLGGLVFSLAGYVGTTDWPQMVNGAVWIPLVLLFLLRSTRGRTAGLWPEANAALAGACLGVAWLSGHHQVPIFATLTAGGLWLYYILREGKIQWRAVRLATIMSAVMFMVGALQILPALEYGHLAQRWVGAANAIRWDQPVPYYVHKEFSLGAIALFAIIFPGLNRHADPYLGVVALGLALLGLALAWRHHVVKIFSAIAIGGLLYSLGQNSVFQGLLYAIVPMVEKARVPSMAVVIFNVGGAVLAAFGLEFFPKEGSPVWIRRMVIGILGFGLLTYGLLMAALFMNKLHWEADDRVAVTALIAVLLAALLYAWRTGNLNSRQAGALLILLLLMELGNNSGFAFPDRADASRRTFIEK